MSNYSIDSLLMNMVGMKLSPEQRKILLGLEHVANIAEQKEDALDLIDSLPNGHEIETASNQLLSRIEGKMRRAIDVIPTYENPTLAIVTGAPGSGKSKKSEGLLNSNSVYLCGDVIKKHFMDEARHDPVLSLDKRFLDATFIHRLTSRLSWSLFNYAQDANKSMVVEMVGSHAESDVGMIATAVDKGYHVSLSHVLTTTQKAITNAVLRYFDENSPDNGRYISLTNIANRQKEVIQSFFDTINLLKEKSIPCQIAVYDNSNWDMKELHVEDVQPSEFIMTHKPSSLWYKGKNHTADMVVVAANEHDDICVAMVKRGKEPFKDCYAMPGGFVNTDVSKGEEYRLGFELPEDAAKRELVEETLYPGKVPSELVKIGVYDDPLRDPRNSDVASVVSHVYMFFADKTEELIGRDDAASAEWVRIDDILSGAVQCAFDHKEIIADVMKTPELKSYLASVATIKVDEFHERVKSEDNNEGLGKSITIG